jgi:hypothetical protein
MNANEAAGHLEIDFCHRDISGTNSKTRGEDDGYF